MSDRRKLLPSRLILSTALCACLLAAASCKKKDDGRLPVYPVKGQILVDGNPVKGVLIYFWPAKIEKNLHAYCPNGQTDDNGHFKLSTYDADDGAPAGEYTITIEWPVGYNQLTNQWHGDHLQGKYSDQGKSEIKLKIDSKPNDLAVIQIEKPKKK